ncbi:hypothetical protein CRG98_003471 [Punica granatum]|uniref:DUF4219 domain-containing protein n=1 Tax=Punica granatum TaxID=22663 RepID=A0A2I0L656_PUNGR|nr:hypothetical protein CRG98_003471 [Punica granatum]
MEEYTGSMFKLNATNYSIWKYWMEDLLFCRDLYDSIKGDSTKPKDKDDNLGTSKSETIDLIRQLIDNNIYHHVAQVTDVKALWDELVNLDAWKTPQNNAFLVKEFVHLCYQDGEIELGCKLFLKKVRHVPEIRLDLISMGQLDDEGFSNKFSSGRWKLSKGSLIMVRR